MQTKLVTDSSMITGIGFDGKNVHVTFKDGNTYEYDDVPSSVFNAFVDAPSKGSFLAKHIKNRYTHRKV